MKTCFSSHLQASARPNHVGPNPTLRAALAFGAVSLVVLIVATLLIFGSSSANANAKAQTAGVTPRTNDATAGTAPPVGSMSDVMMSMVYPAASNILLSVYRGGPQDDKEWVAIQRNAVLLAESGNALIRRGPAGGAGDWSKDAKMLVDVGAAAYKAARAKDRDMLVALDQPLNEACTACHKQYRLNIAGPHEREGPSRQESE